MLTIGHEEFGCDEDCEKWEHLVETEWNPMTAAWWASTWGSPMAVEYLEADVPALFRLAVLIDDFWRRPSTTLASEIRLQQQAFGLTPLDRRRLEWEVEKVASAAKKRAPAAAEPKTRKKAPAAADPRTLLRAVK